MPRYKFKNRATGEEVQFEWNGKKPPTSDDINRISDQQRQGRMKVYEQAQANEPSFIDKVLMHPATSAIQSGLEAVVPKELPWESIPGGISEAYQGAKKVLTPGHRVEGVRDMLRGGMRAASFPIEAVGLATAPAATIAGFEAGHHSAPLVRKAVETVAPEAPPEVKDLATDVGTLAVGAVAGGAAHRVLGPKAPPVAEPGRAYPRMAAPQVEAPVASPRAIPAPVEVPDVEIPRGLPRGQESVTTPPPRIPRITPPNPPLLQGPPTPRPAETAPLPSPVPRSTPPQIESNFGGYLPERGQPIPAEAPPIRMPPAGTYQTEQAFTPPEPKMLPAPGEVKVDPPSGPPPDQVKQAPAATGSVPAVPEPKVEVLAPPPRQAPLTPPVKPPIDIARAALARSSNVRPATPPVIPPVAQPPVGAPPPAPVEEAVQAPPPEAPAPVEEVAPPTPPAPPAPPEPPKVTEPTYPDEFRDAVKKAGYNIDAMSPAQRASAFKKWSIPKVEAPKAPQPAQIPQTPPPVEKPLSPYELAKRATEMIKNAPPPSSTGGAPKSVVDFFRRRKGEQVPAEIIPEVQNKVLEFVKMRGTGTISQIQEKFGIPGDQVLNILKGFEKRGLTGRTGQRWVYKQLEGESIPESPEAPKQLPPDKRPHEIKRGQQLAGLINQVEEGVPGAFKKLEKAQKSYGNRVDAMRAIHEEAARHGMGHKELSAHLKERYGVDSMKNLTDQQMRDVEDELIDKRIGSSRDINARIDELEARDDEGKLSDSERKELHELYNQLGFFRSERGTERIGPRIRDAQRNMDRFLHKVAGSFKSTDLFLEENPATRPIANILKRATLQGDVWEGKYLRDLSGKSDAEKLNVLRDAYNSVRARVELPDLPRNATMEQMKAALEPSVMDIEEMPSSVPDAREILHRLKVHLFERPAASDARDFLSDIPRKFDKDTAQWYIDNWTRRDLQDTGYKFLRTLDRKTAAIGGRSVLFGSTRLQLLHLARLGMQVWPEMGTVHTLNGLARFIAHPQQTWSLLRDTGLLPQSRIPWDLKTGVEKMDYVGNYADLGNSITKAVAFEANLAKFKGNIEKAVNETKRVEGVVGRETPIRALEFAPRNLVQFKYWLGKYLGNVASAVQKKEMGKLGRYIAAAVLLEELSKKTGLTLWHLKASGLVDYGGPFLRTVKESVSKLAKGDVEGAAGRAVRGTTPGGISLWPAAQKMIDGDVEGALEALGPFEKESH